MENTQKISQTIRNIRLSEPRKQVTEVLYRKARKNSKKRGKKIRLVNNRNRKE